MGNKTLAASYSKQSSEVLYPPERWNELKTKILTMDELIRSNRELEQFAMAVSHDLQEPLKVISVYLQIQDKKHQGKSDEDEDRNRSHILAMTERMQDLIQSMLDYARVGKGNINFTQLDSGMVLAESIENLRISIEENSAQISRENCPVIIGDKVQLTQLFQNLIRNAIKFRKKEESPCIHVSVKQEGDQWVFSVKDNGIGMEQKYLQNIFEIFRRLHCQSEYAGNGIGLALCKRIVESHQGRIWAESEIGQGTTVHFTIPRILAEFTPRADHENSITCR